MTKIDIGIKVEMPDKIKDEYRYKDLYEKVQDYILVCNSDEDSAYHWNYLKCLYKRLIKLPKVPHHLHDLMWELEDFMSKNAGYDSGEDQLDLEGTDMFKYHSRNEDAE